MLTRIKTIAQVGSREMASFRKNVNELGWAEEGTARLVDLAYQLKVLNGSKLALTKPLVLNDLDAVLVIISDRAQSVYAAGESVTNPVYTGICDDQSMNGISSDPGENGEPTDNDKPARVIGDI
ncbi:hypothetical protein G8759_04865 [Spirosoma aureum]|uniref:Uncharacterized protein n=1 Tax=Spirosoma aureum TaxID=2692134 RepID=A0A6G9AI60_9BACT|nr:hypothetical protein [Spirosoma aureum]QIP12009.1 hypothetical protein G8759_04865 [Spirosoma aureum]